jgi:hypothetical protein
VERPLSRLSGSVVSVAHHVFGIRHHGPGSARTVLAALKALQPDIVLVEGPPDADDMLVHAARDDISLPVALLVYEEAAPSNAVFYPFAEFSPEWQAIRFALKAAIPVRFMDLPQAMRLGANAASNEAAEADFPSPTSGDDQALHTDPLQALALAAGYADGERWWDHVVESQGRSTDVFAAVNDAMAALREHHPNMAALEAQREATMRQIIRAAGKEGFERIAVVCGAWHAPALKDLPSAAADQALLKGLSKVKTRAAWVPWSYDRLSYQSGYGAGVDSPEWYHLLWQHDQVPLIYWMTHAARLLRAQDLDASSASVIESVRLAEQLAALRGRAVPGLDELLESALSVLCGGQSARLDLIARKLVIGTRLGVVPDDMPATPLMQDFLQCAKRLRLPLSADYKDYDLDLRKETDLARSHLLYRLEVLGVQWGEQARAQVRSRGTFREVWRLLWKPEFAIHLVDGSRFGSTVEEAATGKLIAGTEASVEQTSERLRLALLAQLPRAVEVLLQSLAQQAALARDVGELLRALTPLAETRRYGSVRQTDANMLDTILGGLIARIVIGLPIACAALDDAAAKQMQKTILESDKSIVLLDQDAWTASWREALGRLADQHDLHGLIAGATARLLHDSALASSTTTAQRMSLALSRGTDAHAAAYWIEGFLSGGAQAILLDDGLFGLLDEWACTLKTDFFQENLPLLRRAFSTFSPSERRQLGERVKQGAQGKAQSVSSDFNTARAVLVLPVLATLFAQEPIDAKH